MWERLTRYGLSRSEPWLIIGDGGSLRSADSFVHLNNMIRDSGLLDFPARGNKMSWQG